MRLIRTCDAVNLSLHGGQICVSGHEAGCFYFNDGKLRYISYSENPVPYRRFEYKGQWYTDHVSGSVIYYSFIPYKNKDIVLKDLSGNELMIAPEKTYCIIINRSEQKDGLYVAKIYKFPEKSENSLAWFNSQTDEFKYKTINLYGYNYINQHFYGLDMEEDEFIKLDLNFECLWKFPLTTPCEKSVEPVLYQDTLIVFIGPTQEERHLENGVGRYSYSGGVLYGFSDQDGTVNWQIEFPHAIDKFRLKGERVYVASLNEIYVIHPKTGEVLHIIDTQTSVPKDRDWNLSVYVDDQFIYYTHYDDQLILIYDVNDLSLVKRIELPEWIHPHPLGHNFYDATTGKHYFSLHDKTRYVAQGPVLEIDPTDLDSPIEYEKEPDMEAEFQPSPDNPDEQEFVIKMTTPSLDDALRFGEIYTRDYAQWYSYNYMGMSFHNREQTPNPLFNGVIRFIYSGCDQPEDVVKNHLTIMEKRFANWNEEKGFFSCVDKNKPTRLIAEYR